MAKVDVSGAGAPLVFRGVGIQGYSVGSVDMNSERLKYTSNDRSSSREVPWNRVEYATWATYGRYCHLRLFMKGEGEDNGSDGDGVTKGGVGSEAPVRIDGFTKKNYGDLKGFMSSIDVELKRLKVNCGGGNYGKLDVAPNLITFSHDGRPSFDLDLSDGTAAYLRMVSQCVLPGNNRKGNDVELQFQDSDANSNQDEDVLVEMRLFVAKGKHEESSEKQEGGEEYEEESVAWRNRGAAEEFHTSVINFANIGAVKGAMICQFDNTIGTFMTPRGRFALEMYGSFVRMRGPKYDYRIQYSDMNRFYLLEKPDERYMAFIISLDKPIRQGQQRYQHLVMQSSRTLETVNINLSEEDIAAKYGTQLQPVMEGSLCNTVAKVFKALSGKSVFVASKFRSSEGAKCVSCALGASDGQLYPLNKSLVFIHKPTRVIAFEDIEYVEFQRYLRDKMAGSARRSFDLYVSLKSNHDTNEPGGHKDFTFSGIDRSEYTYLYEWFNGKEVRIENIKRKDDTLQKSALSEALADIGESSDEGEGVKMEDEESEEDNDYAPPSGDSSGGDSGSGSSDESSSSDRDEEDGDKKKKKKRVASEPKKVKEEKNTSSETKRQRDNTAGGGKERKRRKKKDPNAPKGALSAFLLYSIEERARLKGKTPNLEFGEYGKIIGASWKELSSEKKSTWVAKAEEDKQRYKKEKLAYDNSMKTDDDAKGGNSPSKGPSHGGSGDDDDDDRGDNSSD